MLETLIQRREIRQPLAQATISTTIAGRYDQQRAIRAICESLEQGRLKALLVQATGTGKTRTAISLTDVLTRQPGHQQGQGRKTPTASSALGSGISIW